MKTLLLGVTGGIAAYKAADIAHQFHKMGWQVHVVMTRHAAEFVTPLTFRTLTQNRVHIDLFDDNFQNEVLHISLAKRADLVLVAPATANVIGKLAVGIADDMLTTVLLAVKDKPVLIAPAMNTGMWENPAVQENLQKLIRFGYEIIPPKEALLACGDVGQGALASVDRIIEVVLARSGS